MGSLRDAAATVQTLRDRLAAAEGILEASRESFASSKEKSTAARAFSKSQRDVDSDTARRNAIESVVDNASRRFAHDASAFVASFPDKWFDASVHAIVDDWLICAQVDVVATSSRTRRARRATGRVC